MKLQPNFESMEKFNHIVIPQNLSDVVDQGLKQGEILRRKRNIHKKLIPFTSVAAALFLSFIFLAANPSLAAKLPLVGHIFERFQFKNSFSGDFASVATPLAKEDATTSKAEKTEGKNSNNNELTNSDNALYSQTAGGTTVTLSEVYCNNQALYLSLVIECTDKIPDTLLDLEGQPNIAFYTTEKYSFYDDSVKEKDVNVYYPEGEFINAYTYAGILRIDLNSKQRMVNNNELPNTFSLELTINQIIGTKLNPDNFWDSFDITEKEVNSMSEEDFQAFMKENFTEEWSSFPNLHENYWYDGPWNYSIPVTMDESKTETINIGTTNEKGVGIDSVTKTPFELTLSETYENNDASDYFAVALDADGNIMPYGTGGGSTNTFALQKRDISTVYIYICDYVEYMDELKGYYWSEDYEEKKKTKTFKELLDERCVYQTKVHFD